MKKIKPLLPVSFLTILIIALYYKFFLLNQIPFPGDLLVGGYFPWLESGKMPVKNPLISDVFSQFFLWKHLSIDMIKSGQWPLWNPYSFLGTPFLATYHSATLYPLNLLLFLPKYLGWGLFIFSSTLLAGLNMYILTSVWIKNTLPRLAASLVFALGGLMTTWVEFGTAVHGMAWLPLSVFAYLKFIQTFNIRYLILLASSIILIILAGNTQVLIYSILIILSLILLSIFLEWKTNFKAIILVCITLGFSTAISSIQLLPSYELLGKSIRSQEYYIEEHNFGLLPLGDFIKLFSADFYGNVTTFNYWGFLNYSEASSFLGTISFGFLIYLILFVKKTKFIKFFMFVFFFSLFFSFDNPISKIIYLNKIPLLTQSYASRLLFITNFSAAILIAFSFDHFLSNKSIPKLSKSFFWSIIVMIGLISSLFTLRTYLYSIINNAPSIHKITYKDVFDHTLIHIDIALRNLILPSALILIVLLAGITFSPFFIILTKKIHIFNNKFISQIFKLFYNKKIEALGLLIIFLIMFDLGRYFLKFNPFVGKNIIYPNHESISFVQNLPGQFRLGRDHDSVFPPNTWINYNIQSLEGYDPLYIKTYADYIHFINGGNIVEGGGSRYAELYNGYQSKFLDATNTKYFITITRDGEGHTPGDNIPSKFRDAQFKTIFKTPSTAILENPDAVNRVFFAKKVDVSSQLGLRQKMTTDFNFDPTSEVILEKDLNIVNVSGNGIAEILEYTPSKVVIKTNANQDELLVLADQYEDGWKAFIDNQETIISPANLVFRAIKVPAGTHNIVFTYLPNSFKLGLIISSISLTGFGVFLIVTGKILKGAKT